MRKISLDINWHIYTEKVCTSAIPTLIVCKMRFKVVKLHLTGERGSRVVSSHFIFNSASPGYSHKQLDAYIESFFLSMRNIGQCMG